MRKIETSSGVLTGRKTDYGYEFLGIPYAQAERFKPPLESKWDGVRECVKFGPKAFQCTNKLEECSEDCLNTRRKLCLTLLQYRSLITTHTVSM